MSLIRAFGLVVVLMGLEASAARAEDVSRHEAARFLIQASFGATQPSIASVQRLGYGGWIEAQFDAHGPTARERFGERLYRRPRIAGRHFRDFFWERALYGEDQLRMRVMFALSQIVVIASDDVDSYQPVAFANYLDMLHRASFGNYCDLVREVTMSPMMAHYLTYYGNMKADPETGRAPDENYAREVMQLFTIGLEELNLDGSPRGQETYTARDVEGLAAVFTGLASPASEFAKARLRFATADAPLTGYPAFHEPGPKRFLGTTIPGGLSAEESVSRALDHLLAHPNVAPFIARQLIQKLVVSNPSASYIERVATVFNEGRFTMPSGKVVGAGRRCDMKATVSAILLDPEARDRAYRADPTYGKIREPVLRIASIIRALSDPAATAPEDAAPRDTEVLRMRHASHNQLVFSPPSVFGFYRPGYVAAGTEAARAGLVAPEMQVFTSEHAIAQHGLVQMLLRGQAPEFFARDDARLVAAAMDAPRLVGMLDLQLTAGRLSRKNRRRIIAAVREIWFPFDGERRNARLMARVALATAMIMSTPEFIVQI